MPFVSTLVKTMRPILAWAAGEMTRKAKPQSSPTSRMQPEISGILLPKLPVPPKVSRFCIEQVDKLDLRDEGDDGSNERRRCCTSPGWLARK